MTLSFLILSILSSLTLLANTNTPLPSLLKILSGPSPGDIVNTKAASKSVAGELKCPYAFPQTLRNGGPFALVIQVHNHDLSIHKVQQCSYLQFDICSAYQISVLLVRIAELVLMLDGLAPFSLTHPTSRLFFRIIKNIIFLADLQQKTKTELCFHKSISKTLHHIPASHWFSTT